jgi:hypothetical protein
MSLATRSTRLAVIKKLAKGSGEHPDLTRFCEQCGCPLALGLVKKCSFMKSVQNYIECFLRMSIGYLGS